MVWVETHLTRVMLMQMLMLIKLPIFAPALAILMAHSAADTPCMSPSGPMHMLAPTGRLVLAHSSMAHSISSICSKY